MIYELSHVTRYDYDAPVTASYAKIHQLPGDLDGQVCLRRCLTTEPAPEHHRELTDHFGNRAAVVAIREPHQQLVVTSTAVVDTTARPVTFGPEGRDRWEEHLATRRPDGDLTAIDLSIDSPLVARSEGLAHFARPSFRPGRPLADAVGELSDRINAEFTFDPEATDVDTPLDEVLTARRGVCQDLAHVLIGCLRSLGLAAAYVSGYLETEPPPGSARLTGADRTHAWVGLHLGGDRFIGVDPTNAQLAGPRYITTARGRDYGDVPPLKGVIYTDAEESELTVAVDVVRADTAGP
ncbi:MAG: transglutaminase N-terminal domain-containing protein [Acidimicrobiales bacterium]